MRNVLISTLTLSLLMVSCNKEEKKEKDPAPAEALEGVAGDLVDKANEAKKTLEGLAKGGKALTIAEYEKLLLNLASCEVKKYGPIDNKCPAWKKFLAARKKNRGNLSKNLSGRLGGLGRKHVKHESPAVRIQSVSFMRSIFGANKSNQDTIIEAAKTEKDPRVLRKMIRTVMSSIAKNEKIKELVLSNVEHTDSNVRTTVASALASTWAEKADGTLEKVMEMVEKDPDEKVRRHACSLLGQRGDERALPLLTKLTKDAKTDPKMYADCLKGLIKMWCSVPVHEKPSEKAYKLTIARLSVKPRTDKNPPWTAFSGLMWAKREKFQQRAPWFKKDKLMALLDEIANDRKAHWMARTGAIDAMKHLGADKAALEGLKKKYKGSSGKDGLVLKKIERDIKKMDEKKKK